MGEEALIMTFSQSLEGVDVPEEARPQKSSSTVYGRILIMAWIRTTRTPSLRHKMLSNLPLNASLKHFFSTLHRCPAVTLV
ncbi:Pentatricopeptide repeat superfamily protein [Prunus dulcis]|uniref:Pentatricopeptide repeat superfamily protein n=1 Tax=Prunus dulcis TaxID=3755 RepID=A0A4Y1QUZ4_PRUDU|nr:Pentatricopeptide repeat superfamily protein [Prunus dulcis]